MLQIQTLVVQFTTSLQTQLGAVEVRDAKFADQLRRALLSIGMNLGEGYGASGGAKRRAYRIALGEARELEMGLAMAVALGYCRLRAEQRGVLDHVIGTLVRLAVPRG